jgi:hypothetical protein
MAAIIAVAKGGGGYTCKVPLDLLAQDGVPPEQGDSVSYSVEGTVQSTDAEDATVKITSVNGEPVDESPADEAAEDQGQGGPDTGLSSGGGPSTAQMGAALRAGAKGKPLPF